MTLRDALLLISHRDRFSDMEVALAFVGAALEDPLVAALPPKPSPPLLPDLGGDDPDMLAGDVTDAWSADRFSTFDDAEDVTGDPSDDWKRPGRGRGGDVGQGQGRDHGSRSGRGRLGGHERNHLPTGTGPNLIAGLVDLVIDHDAAQVTRSAVSEHTAVPTIAADPAPQVASPAFNARTLPSDVHSLVRARRDSNELDIDQVVKRIAHGEPLTSVPMIRRLGRPVDICLMYDIHLRSGPYQEDLRHLLWVARRLFGDGQLTLLGFDRTPANGCGAGPVWTWRSYWDQPHSHATMIVGSGVVGRSRDPLDLHEFALEMGAAGRQVCVVLIGAEPGTSRTHAYPQLLVED